MRFKNYSVQIFVLKIGGKNFVNFLASVGMTVGVLSMINASNGVCTLH